MTHAPALAPRPAHFVSAARVKAGTLWLLVASSSIVLIEPAPYDAVFVVAFGLFALAGPGVRRGVSIERNVWCIDLVPTLCHHAGWPVPRDTEGAVIYQAFDATTK